MLLLRLRKILWGFFSRICIKALFNGVFASIEHKDVLISIKPMPKTLIDIGANKGQFALAARYIFPDAKIISFEPLSCAINKFIKVFKNDTNIVLHQTAIGIEKKTLPIHVSKRNDSSSILPIGKTQSSIFPGTEESHVEEISVAPLDNFILPSNLIFPVFVKIDVQGYELEVLKGCEDLIVNFDYIYVECSFIELYKGQALVDEVISFLSTYSFKLQGMYNTYYDKKGLAVQADFLFKKR